MRYTALCIGWTLIPVARRMRVAVLVCGVVRHGHIRSVPGVCLSLLVCFALAGEGFPVLGRWDRIYGRVVTEGEAGSLCEAGMVWMHGLVFSVSEALLSLIVHLALAGEESPALGRWERICGRAVTEDEAGSLWMAICGDPLLCSESASQHCQCLLHGLAMTHLPCITGMDFIAGQ